ncbi:MAG: hypothetical protein NUW21_11980, partial [Elusimicrobia bacterium]|nr:hypothetical protein [Elusimicrobiota bacterium]
MLQPDDHERLKILLLAVSTQGQAVARDLVLLEGLVGNGLSPGATEALRRVIFGHEVQAAAFAVLL